MEKTRSATLGCDDGPRNVRIRDEAEEAFYDEEDFVAANDRSTQSEYLKALDFDDGIVPGDTPNGWKLLLAIPRMTLNNTTRLRAGRRKQGHASH